MIMMALLPDHSLKKIFKEVYIIPQRVMLFTMHCVDLGYWALLKAIITIFFDNSKTITA
jgi:hypothetical protein